MQSNTNETKESTWVQVDRDITAHARNRAAADYEEGRLLLAAKRTEVWKHFGASSLQQYVHWRLGYDFHTTNEKIRVAEELEKNQKLAAALFNGDVHWSKVREVSRIIVDETTDEWIDAMKRMNARELERLCATLQRGDPPTAKGDPSRIKRVLRFETSAEEYAVATGVLDSIKRANGGKLSDSQCFAMAMQLAASQLGKEDVTAAAYQVNLSKCPDCERGAVNARGEEIAVRPDVVERADCDSVIVDAHEPARACRTVPPKTMRMVKARARGRCEVPGCRNHIWLQCHHRRLRSEGGTHDPENLIVVCQPCHDALHDGSIFIEGTRQTGLIFHHADGTPLGAPAADPVSIDVFEKAFAVIRMNGVSEEETRRVLAIVRREHPSATLEEVVRFALLSAVREATSHVGLVDGCIESSPPYGFC